MIGDKSLQTMEYVVLIIGSILWLFWIVSSVLTIVGAVQRKKTFYIPWFVATGLQCFLMLFQCFYMTVVLTSAGIAWTIAVIAVQLIVLGICIYAMVCVGMDLKCMNREQRVCQHAFVPMAPVGVGASAPGAYPQGYQAPQGQYPVAYYAVCPQGATTGPAPAPPAYQEKPHPDNYH
ncbi:uncharacterized protein LOC106155352 [Lingula anatina]|uniref:Uncharacterized protein LOC106155352 n=1 Tax=Lingula anatina TaxID=7574 RepID=A0A1S3HHL8_LINAN|nr:uncharacterized protein LOC106155352 [Lingula anatina]|eukprot:XP_013385600.1 uncharacterized protein LOC106155352 [Lingula anatina]